MITIVQISKPASPVPSEAARRREECIRATVEEITGDSLTVTTAEQFAATNSQPSAAYAFVHLLAIEGELTTSVTSEYGFPLVAGSADGVALWESWDSLAFVSLTPEQAWNNRVIGSCSIDIPMKENLDSAYVDFNATSDNVAALLPLWEAAQKVLTTEGRTKVSAWSDNPLGGELKAETSTITLSPTHITDFLTKQGFVLNHSEQCVRLQLPVPDSELVEIAREAYQRSAGYRLVSWMGKTPENLVESYATLINAFLTDIPTAGLINLEANIDVERIRKSETNLEKSGITQLVTAALHEESGELVGYTRYDVYPGMVVAMQEDTLVLKEHRGHRLGILVKIENLRLLERHFPECTAAQTWNAGENDWMIAINDQLGYRPYLATGQWQREIPA
ncbi:hypothetical protein [Flaviflexus massiliensis]|uniref:hypothetical protein n=1 Tax=Flaviflexus massiliensis TaxID=1522309 RepID=UPI0006D5A957|nr:hypothetical protein [Flaviflexus massiliensis]